MDKQQQMKIAIQNQIGGLMEKIMDRVLNTDPFSPEEHKSKKPLYAALVPDEIFKGAHFERRFVTPFGSTWEELAVIAADHGIGSGKRGVKISGEIGRERINRITETLNKLGSGRRGKNRTQPDWDKETEYILAGGGDNVPIEVISDVLVTDGRNGRRLAFEIKAPQPNSDQTKVSKEKILKLFAMDPCQVDEAYFALPYNPYGTRDQYSWPHPGRWFDMRNDPVVLIGDEFWDKIGGTGTYQSFISAVNEIAREYKERIYREYLGMKPPTIKDPFNLD